MTDGLDDLFDPAELAAIRRSAREGLRRRVAAQRRALPADGRAARSAAACVRALALPEVARAGVVLGYAALRYELDPRGVLDACAARGTRLCLPRALPDGGLSLHAYSEGDALVESGLGVMEPPATAPEVDPATVDLVLVPALAWDECGFRLGFGKGYYDRLLPRLPRAVRVGLGFDMQLVAELPREDWDAPVHLVVTDRRVVDARPPTD